MKYNIHRDINFRHPGEKKAWELLKENDHFFIARNFHTGRTEIDLITLKGSVFHFIEVKQWKGQSIRPEHSLKKVAHLRRKAALLFVSELSNEANKLFTEKEDRHIIELLEQPFEVEMSFDLMWIHNTGHNFIEAIF